MLSLPQHLGLRLDLSLQHIFDMRCLIKARKCVAMHW